jgi:hypothetical protein
MATKLLIYEAYHKLYFLLLNTILFLNLYYFLNKPFFFFCLIFTLPFDFIFLHLPIILNFIVDFTSVLLTHTHLQTPLKIIIILEEILEVRVMIDANQFLSDRFDQKLTHESETQSTVKLIHLIFFF